ncbi:DUF1793-domain-containing protein [Epithele typhae]|uniref:DUF1793-domain-containing protein n=1 Tax=Epithele typhae TaxID=378194 RepID=UPI0020076AD5|nr:DUF1793-domain-containing protein [Epithele typhae]KAH9940434.1 DUF1793-domain-containing protein [Epithele typhae]
MFAIAALTALFQLASFILPALAAPAWDVTPINPAAIPLAVRSPYLSAWLPQGGGTALNAAWPTFWNGNIVGWAGYAKVDGTAYTWMGVPAVPNTKTTPATQKSFQARFSMTATQSIFVMSAGPVDLTITFLSPVEPGDFVNQSLPLSYYSVSAASTDGKSHSVQVYADISAEWNTGTVSLGVTWNTTAQSVISHQVALANQVPFNELGDRIQQGSVFHSTLNTKGTTFQTGEDIAVRAQFINSGALTNGQDTAFRAVSDRWPVFAFAHDFGAVSAATAPFVLSLAHVRDPALQYVAADGTTEQRSSFFWTKYADFADAISAFLGDYANAVVRANAFDAKLQADAGKISADYASLVPLSVRQTLGAIEITAAKKSDGSLDASDVKTFMKEISSSGDVNTVDVIFPSWPLFLYTNPEIGKQLLLPLLAYQASGLYPNKYSVHDLGSHYPNATGHNDGKDQAMPVEESGNMVIMALSHAQTANDQSLLKTYFSLLDQWTQFLITDSLIPADQLSTDDFAGSLANQTNLAIKGIVGIKAMSKIAALTGDNDRATKYSSMADSYVQQWKTLATSADGKHLTLSYGNSDSWGLAYNLYADKLLGTNAFPQDVYDLQTEWYNGQAKPFGVQLDTRHTYTKSDWQIWTAGIMSATQVRDMFVSSVLKYAGDGATNQPLPDLYDAINGTEVPGSGHARPVVGGHFALVRTQ